MRIRFIAAITFFSLIYTFFYSILPDPLAIIYKLFPMLLILLLAISIHTKVPSYKKNIIIALVFCTIGDYTFQSSLVVGATPFLIGYLFYIRAFLTVKSHQSPSFTMWMFTVFGMTTMYWIGSFVLAHHGIVSTIAFCLYILVLIYMGWMSFKTTSHFAIAGALLFIFSDLVLAINTFISPSHYSHQLIMVTYYTAQLLLTLSIADYSKNKMKSDTMKQT